MSQHDYNIANQSFPATRTDLNNALGAIQSNNSGSTGPSVTAPFMTWADDSTNLLKTRNAADNAWVKMLPITTDMVETAKTTNYTVIESDFGRIIPCNATAAGFTVALGAAGTLGEGFKCTIVKTDATANAVVIDPNGSETINGAATLSVTTQYQAVTFMSDGANWLVINVAVAVVNPIGKHTIAIPAGALRPRSTSGCAPLATSNGASNQPDVPYLAFDPATAEYAGIAIRMPKGWNEGTVTATFSWRRESGTGAGNVVWGMRAVAVSDNDTPATNFGTAATVTSAAKTTTANFVLTAETSACTIGASPAELDLVFFEFFRDAANGSDTLTSDAWLTGVNILYSTDAATDA